MPIVTINYDKCKGIDCAECVDVCPMEVLVLEGDKVEIVDPEDCSFCEVCMDVCPEECVNVELIGENMGLLIGKRGQTLDSIQYLTSLVLNKGKEKYVRIKVDTENYRQRRKDTLESLAKNIAYKVKRSRRSVALEPMNPYERRIIHSALQGDKFVSTKSEGEEPFRHVVVYLDREKAGNNRYSEHRYSDNNRYSR